MNNNKLARCLWQLPRWLGLLAVIGLIGSLGARTAQAQSEDLFPRPPELQPAVDFWVKVYTEVDTQHGFLHDPVNLAVIYASVSRDRASLESVRDRIRADLRVLASGRRSNLSPSQRDILALWPEGVSNRTLQNAANNVRFQLGQSDRFLGGLIRSGAYRAHINRVIRERNLPIELGVLPHVESSFNPNAYSSAAASGMWQFTQATGQRFMRIDHIVDERMDPYIATEAAMSLLEYNYSVLGTWPLALTAYNHGAGGMARAVRETGSTAIETIVANYRGRAFGFASRNFYAQFLAVLQVENNARQYFGDFRLEPAPDFVEISTDAFIDAEVFAGSVGVSLGELRADNPALRPVVWEGNKRIPRGFPVKVRRQVAAGGDLLARIPSDFKFSVQTPDVEYVVERGDSLSVIARRFNTSVSDLVALNQLRSQHRIQIGQRLLLPQDGIDSTQLAGIADLGGGGVYTVRRGDTVSLIAARYNVSARELLGANGIANENLIYPGQELRLPGFAAEAGQVSTKPVAVAALNELGAEEGGGELDEATVSEPQTVAAASESAVAPTDSTPTQLALAGEEVLPPAAVLPDNQELDSPVTQEEEDAFAVDPRVDVAASNEQLSELLAADPSDYSVAANATIEIQASETLGHYAEWLGVRTWDLRRLNNMAYRDPVIIGERLRLDFSQVSIAEFEVKRRDFHSSLQNEFFSSYRIQDVESYEVRRGDNVGGIARSRYNTPVWLLRQYNPDLDFNRIQIGQSIVFPILESVN